MEGVKVYSSEKFNLTFECVDVVLCWSWGLVGEKMCCEFVSIKGVLSWFGGCTELCDVVIFSLVSTHKKWSLVRIKAILRCCKNLRKLSGGWVFGVACSAADSNNILARFFLSLLLIEGHDLPVKIQNLLILNLLGDRLENIGVLLFLILLLVSSLLKNIRSCISSSGYSSRFFFVQKRGNTRFVLSIIIFPALIHCKFIAIFLLGDVVLTKVSELVIIGFQSLRLRNAQWQLTLRLE